MRIEQKLELNEYLTGLNLYKELKNTVRSVDVLSSWKAKEVKTVVLYLVPVILPQFLFGEERRTDEVDIQKFVFSVRDLYGSSANVEFCNLLLNEFYLSVGVSSEKKGSNNFH